MNNGDLRPDRRKNRFSGFMRAGAAVAVAGALLSVIDVPEAAAESQAQVADPARGKGVKERQQERKKGEEFKPIGARVGAFQFFPSLEVDVEYGDNIFATQTGGQSDVLTRIRPEFALKSDWNNHELNLKAVPEVIRYYRFTDDSVENYDFSADGRIDVLRALKVDLDVSYALGNEDRGDPNAVASASSPTETKTTKAHVGMEWKPAWVSLSIDGDFTDSDFKDVTNRDASITNNDDRDRDKKEITVRLGREYLPDTEMFVKASYNIINYNDGVDDAGLNRDSDGYEIVVGTDLDFTGIVTGNVFGGYISQGSDDATLEDIAGPTVGASVNWAATPLMSVNGTVTRSIQETTTGNSPGFFSSLASVKVDYEILRQLTASAKVKGSVQDYESIARRDKVLDFDIGAEYLFNRNFSAKVKYAFKRKTSDAVGLAYTQNTVLLSGRAQF